MVNMLILPWREVSVQPEVSYLILSFDIIFDSVKDLGAEDTGQKGAFYLDKTWFTD